MQVTLKRIFLILKTNFHWQNFCTRQILIWPGSGTNGCHCPYFSQRFKLKIMYSFLAALYLRSTSFCWLLIGSLFLQSHSYSSIQEFCSSTQRATIFNSTLKSTTIISISLSHIKSSFRILALLTTFLHHFVEFTITSGKANW